MYVAVVIAGALVGEKVCHPPAGSRSDLPSPWTRRGRLPRYSLAGAIHHQSRRSPTPRLAALVSLTPPPPNAQVVNNGFDAMWESRNKGKLFKDMTIPEPSEE